MASFVLNRQGVSNTVNVGVAGSGLSSVASLRHAASQRPPLRPSLQQQQQQPPMQQPMQPPMQQQQQQQQQQPMQQPMQQPRQPPMQQPRQPPANYAPSVTFSELDLYANQSKLKAGNGEQQADDQAFEYDDFEEEDDGGQQPPPMDGFQTAARVAVDSQPHQSFSFAAAPQTVFNAPVLPPEPTPAQVRERVRLLAKLRRRNAKKPLEQQVPIDDNASIESLRVQSAGASYETKAKMAVLMMRRVTTFIAKVVEGICQRYPEYTTDLDGWAENVYLSLDQYDDMLYDIYDEYGDHFKGNPIIIYIFALGSNAAMYAMARKIVSNPVGNQVLSGLASAFSKASAGASAPPAVRVPPPTDRPAVPVAVADSGAASMAPGADLAGMFGGADLGEMLGGLDLNGLLSNMGDLLGGASNRRTGSIDITESPTPRVNAMSGVPAAQDAGVMELLRKQQDASESESKPRPLPPILEMSGTDPTIRVVDDAVSVKPTRRSARGQAARLSLDSE